MIGRRLGVFEIQSLLGTGGMGEVYRARDTRLDRDVAVKVLPPAFAEDPGRVSRFEREAKLLAALNHPNIAAIYGVEESAGVLALVLELVEGQTLAERLRTGPMPVREVLAVAAGIADALEAAHEKSIIHRDLKPANIKLTPAGKVKVLDFGLAKALVGGGVGSDVSESPTVLAMDATREGVIAGTIGYMSPEQARAGKVDRRTDIWAFGCVLYEMLTGRPAFARETPSDTIAAILEREPDWRALPPATPPPLRRLLERCLEKDPARRLRDVGDAHVELQDALSGDTTGERAPVGRRAWRRAAGGALALAVLGAAAIATWRASRARDELQTSAPSAASSRSEWTQLTRLADPVGQPALSSDGRILTFVRGPSTFVTPGDIFVKMLPDGDAVQLTHDGVRKMSPAISPDDTEVAYTRSDGGTWDTWVVPISGGAPRLWLPNASGLVWLDARRLLFSEILNGDIHMAIVAADVSRANERRVYVPAGDRDMAHRSWPSPDGRWAIVAEMSRAIWLPCRLVSIIDSGTMGRQIGPPGVECLSAAWSPDGNWMYVSANAGGAFHIWRQRFPDGAPEQVTSGPTEEEGIAMAPDGRSFVTAVGIRESGVWLHDSSGDRPISGEGFACDPTFTSGGRRLIYRVLHGVSPLSDPSEMRIVDLDNGRAEAPWPGVPVVGMPGRAYDVSPDGRTIVLATEDARHRPRLWIASLDHRSAPQEIPNVEGGQPRFTTDGDVLFWRNEGAAAFVYLVHQDGTGLRKAFDEPLPGISGFSPDRRWVVAKIPGASGSRMMAMDLVGGSRIPLTTAAVPEMTVRWSADARTSFWTLTPSYGSTYEIPLAAGRMFPDTPRNGFDSAAAIARIAGARRIESADAAPGPAIGTFAFVRETVQRNLYRVPVP